jgi:uncharacterized protein (DUF1778 family)
VPYTQLNVRIPEEALEAARAAASLNDMSLSEFVRQAMEAEAARLVAQRSDTTLDDVEQRVRRTIREAVIATLLS